MAFAADSERDINSTCELCGADQYCSSHHPLPQQQKGQNFSVHDSGDERGRFLVAARDVSIGEVVLFDRPLVVAPASKSAPVCLNCFRRVEDEAEDRCPDCKLPLCREGGCRGQDSYHGQEECRILCETLSRMSSERRRRLLEATRFEGGKPCPMYASIGPLRLLLLKGTGGGGGGENEEIWRLMDHGEDRRRGDPKTWMLNHVHVVGFLRGACRLETRFSDDDVHRAIGLLRTNGVRLETGGRRGIVAAGLYPVYSLLNHSCLPNTRTRKNPRDGHSVEVVATVAIAKGEQIFTRYTTPEWGTLRRQQVLQRHWYFVCGCRRCKDPTELGSMLNALRCQKGCRPEGFLLPLDPTNLDSVWKCSGCLAEMTAVEAKRTVLAAEVKVENWRWEDGTELIGELEATALHPNHFLLIRLREKMVEKERKRLMPQSSSPAEVADCLKRQLVLLKEMRSVMAIADPPGRDMWDEAVAKIERDLVKLETCEQS